MEMSYLRWACGVTRWEGESNESVYERCDMGACASGVKCGVMKWVKRNTVRWFGHIVRMNTEDFAKKVYVSEIEGPNRRGRPLGRWKDRVKEYVLPTRAKKVPLEEQGLNRQGGSVWTVRGGGCSAVITPLRDVPGESGAPELLIQ